MYAFFENIFNGISKMGTEGFTDLYLILQLLIFIGLMGYQGVRIRKEIRIMKKLQEPLSVLQREPGVEAKEIDQSINKMFHDVGKTKYKELWTRYYNRVSNKDEDERIKVEPFFGFDTMQYHMGYRPLMDVGAGLFVSIGVLGTFIGLSVGLSDLNINANSEALRSGIGGLLSGMKVAFYTSVWGVLLSLIWTGFDRLISSRLAEQIDWHSERLDYLLSTEDEELFLNRMEKISRNQADHLKTLLTDALENAMQPVVASLQLSNGQVTQAFGELNGQFSTLQEGVHLQTKLLESQVELTKSNGQHMTDSLVKQITGGTEETIANFSHLVQDTQMMQQQMMQTVERVVSNFADSERYQANTFKKTEEMVAQFENTLSDMADMREGFKDMSAFIVEIQGTFQNLQQLTKDQIPVQNEVMQSNQQLANKYDNLTESFSQFNREIEGKYEELLEQVIHVSTTMSTSYREMTGRFEQALNTQEKNISESERLLESVQHIVGELTPIAPGLIEVTGNIETLKQQLLNMQQAQVELLPELVSMRTQTNTVVEEALHTTKSYMHDMSAQLTNMQANWSTTKETLEETNKSLVLSMKDFKENIDSGLSKTYHHFDETLTNAVTQVSTMVNRFREAQEDFVESMEDLSDNIEKTAEVMKR